MRCDGRVVAGRRALAVLGIVTLVPAVAGAQHGRPRPALEPPVEYPRVLPEACLAMPDFVDYLRLEGRPDTAQYTPERDRLSPEAAVEVARCREAVGRSSPHPWQWPALARAALAVGNDTAAKAWHDKYLAHLTGAALPRRAWAQYLIASAYADAPPPRLAAAQAALQTLDVMGAPAARARVLAHHRLMEAARRQWQDTLRVRAAQACVRAYRDATPALRHLLSIEAAQCVLGQAEVALRHHGGAPALAILDSGLAVLKGTNGGEFLHQWWRPIYALVDRPAPPIEATRWFRRQGAAGKPAPGTVTLLHQVTHVEGSAAQYQALRRLAARFAGRPFELIAQTTTLGFFGDSGAPMPPQREMTLDSAYFYGYAGMPGMLAIYATQFTIGVDGRRLEQPTPQQRNYQSAGLVLIDKGGRVRYGDVEPTVSGHQEEVLARLIETLLAES